MKKLTSFICIAVLLIVGTIPTNQLPKAQAALPTCTHLLGTGTTIRLAIVPAGFDDEVEADVADFQRLVDVIVAGFAATEPYKSNLDKISIDRADDYRGRNINANSDEVWYNSTLIQAAGVCDYNQILVVGHNSGWAGGGGNYAVTGSGVPPTCDPEACTGVCPWTPTCSWDYNVAYTSLHETGHSIARFWHTCMGATEIERLKKLEKVPQYFLAPQDDDPLNCGVEYTGNPEQTCAEWNTTDILSWVLPSDPTFGCYQNCADRSSWYRPWFDAPGLMCIDFELVNGYSPVERKILRDIMDCRTLQISTDPQWAGYVNQYPYPECMWYLAYWNNTPVRLEAVAFDPAWVFSGWVGDIITTTNPLTVTMADNLDIRALFEPATKKVFVPMVAE